LLSADTRNSAPAVGAVSWVTADALIELSGTLGRLIS
jgi:hypothetical protein